MEEYIESWSIDPQPGLFSGSFSLPGDERISILALAFGALAVGTTSLFGVVETSETVSIRRILAHIGVSFTTDEEGWLNISHREGRLQAPEVELDCGASAEAFCFMLGALAGQRFASELVADASVQHPALELVQLLVNAGARIEPWVDGGRMSVRIKGNPLYPLSQSVGVGSYLRKTALIIAGLSAVGENVLEEAGLSCDHAERMLRTMGVNIGRRGTAIAFDGEQRLHSRRIRIPGDISLATALFVVTAARPGSKVTIEDVGTNPGRTGLIKVLSRAGLSVNRDKNWQYGNEPVANITVDSQRILDGFNVSPNLLPSVSHDIPMLALAATQAAGTSHIIGVETIDEWTSSRLTACCQVLRSFGADIESEEGTLTIRGPIQLHGTEVQCGGDRAISMMAATAAVLAEGSSLLHGSGMDVSHHPLIS